MAALYVHIPFCRQACHYCDFHFSTTLHRVPEMVEGLINELRLRRDEISEPIKTVYFGGGTPSMLTTEQLDRVFSAIEEHYTLADSVEWTLEANPDDLSSARLTHLAEGRVNRLSIGIQAFEDRFLKAMNRSHSADQAKQVIIQARTYGFRDLTADLIYGQPEMSLSDWNEQVKRLLDFELPHFSSYALTVEPKTALAHQVSKGLVKMPDEGLIEDQFHLLRETASSAGYEHYEVSNFGLPGHRSKHNTSYWQGIPYLGIGPSAHSYLGSQRRWNIANNAEYLKGLENGTPFWETETLTETDRFNEWVMTGLRLIDGLEESVLSSFSTELQNHFEEEAKFLVSIGQLERGNGKIRIKPDQRFLSDGIASELFKV